MNKLKKILLIGCGELGSRHLQAIASLGDVGEIDVVEPNDKSIELGKERIKEISDLNDKIKFRWFKGIDKSSSGGDLCIVATRADVRCRLVKQAAGDLNYKYFLIEKIVSQSVREYADLMDFAAKKGLSIWVNCKTRSYEIHKYIKSHLNNSEPIVFSRIGGNHGLATNGVHTADLFIYYDGTREIKSCGSRIDNMLHSTKRSQGVYDLSGCLYGYSDKGSDFMLSFAAGHTGPDLISITSPSCRFIVDHSQRFCFEGYPESGWQWKPVPITENWLVSNITKQFARDIFDKGACGLPTLKECFPAHKYILEELLPYFNKLLKVDNGSSPVT